MRTSSKCIAVGSWAFLCVAALLSACAPLALSAQSGSGCRPADAVVVPEHLTYFRDLLTATEPARAAVRDSLGLTKTTVSKINLVTKASTCTSAVTALNTQRGEPNTARQVWVYTLGSDFAVEDPSMPAAPGEYRLIYLFNSRFVYKGTLAGI